MRWDSRRRLLFESWLQLGLVAIIVLFANILASRHFMRVDLTRDRLYSLDQASKGIVGKLEKPLVVKAYFTRGLEAPYNNQEALFRDKLEELRAYAGGKLQFSIVDPASDPAIAEEAAKYGLAPLDYTVKNQDRSELRKIWLGAVLLYADRQETLPAITDLPSLEYDLASAIHRLQLSNDDHKVIGYTVGHGEADLGRNEGALKSLAQNLGKKFRLQPIKLGGEGTIPEEVDALLVLGPQQALPSRALYQIDQFLIHGGSAGIFLMNVRPDLRTYRAASVVTGLDPLLGHYGIQVGRNVVLDRVQNGSMRFPVKVGQMAGYKEINYPLIAKITDFSNDAVLVSGADQMLFPFASTLTPVTPPPEGVKIEVLARSSASSGAVQTLKTVDPTALGEILPGEERGPFAVLVSVTGPLRSFFETRPAPPPDPDAEPVVESEAPEEAPLQVEGNATRLVVSGSADFVANNQAFMLNLCDWLVQDEALIGIRSKVSQLPPLRTPSPGAAVGWKVFNLLFGPLLLFAYGASRQLRRRVVKGTP